MKFAADGVRLMISDEFARPSRLWEGSRFPSSEPAGRIGQLGVDLIHWTLDPGNVAPTTGIEQDVGQQAAEDV